MTFTPSIPEQNVINALVTRTLTGEWINPRWHDFCFYSLPDGRWSICSTKDRVTPDMAEAKGILRDLGLILKDGTSGYWYGKPYCLIAKPEGWECPARLCPDCEELEDECTWGGDHPVCPDCRCPILRCSWNGGRCLDCHEASLNPYEWDANEAEALADERHESYLLDGGPYQ